MKPLYTETNPNPFHGKSMIPRAGDFSFAKHFRRTRRIIGRPTLPMEQRQSISHMKKMRGFEDIWPTILKNALIDMIIETMSPMAPIGGGYPTQSDGNAKVSYNQVTGSTSFASINKNKSMTVSKPSPAGRTAVYPNRDTPPRRLPDWK